MSIRGLASIRPPRRGLVLAALIASASLSHCAYGPEEETGTVAYELNANTRAAYDYFIGRGLTPVQSAGIVGNLIQESNCSPTAVQSGGPGRGIAQWSVGGRWDHDSSDNVVWYASTHGGADRWSLNLQLDFIWYELNHFSWLGFSSLRSATTVTAATVAFERNYEGCGSCLESQRISYANQVLSAYGSIDWGAAFVSQSFPYASVGAVSVPSGGSTRVSITMRNTGSRAWDSHTCLATTMPRDRRSPLAGSEWPGANRPACVPAGTTVAHGANHTFSFLVHGPAMTGHYDEHWGMVEDGVTWFSATGEGGPPDDQLEGIFEITAPVAPADAGAPRDAGSPADVVSATDASTDDAAMGNDDAGAIESDGGVASRDAARGDVVGDRVGDGGMESLHGGCSVNGPRGGSRGAPFMAVLVAIGAVVSGRRRKPSPPSPLRRRRGG